jgi:hypothetical protein
VAAVKLYRIEAIYMRHGKPLIHYMIEAETIDLVALTVGGTIYAALMAVHVPEKSAGKMGLTEAERARVFLQAEEGSHERN